MPEAIEPRTYLTADELFSFPDLEEQDVLVRQWGSRYVRVRALTLDQVARVEREATDPKTKEVDDAKKASLLFIASVIEPKLEPVQFLNLRKKSAAAIGTVLKAIGALSGTTVDAAKSGGDEVPE